MNIVILSGSHREGSQTRRVCDHIASELQSKKVTYELIDLSQNPLPLNSSTDSKTAEGKKTISTFLASLSKADGYIIASPEWAGAATPAIMNALSLAGNTVAHKPAMIVSVSSGRGGTLPIPQIRSYGYKNNKIVFVPDHIVVHKVNEVLIDNPLTEDDDLYIRERISWSLSNLVGYAHHLKNLREELSQQLFDERFGNGMS